MLDSGSDLELKNEASTHLGLDTPTPPQAEALPPATTPWAAPTSAAISHMTPLSLLALGVSACGGGGGDGDEVEEAAYSTHQFLAEPGSLPEVQLFKIIDHQTGQVIAQFSPGINSLNVAPDRVIRVEVQTSAITTGVDFTFDNYSLTENSRPFALWGDNKGLPYKTILGKAVNARPFTINNKIKTFGNSSQITLKLDDIQNNDPTKITPKEAARFLAQSAMGGNSTDIQQVINLGYKGWIDKEKTTRITQTGVQWLVDLANGGNLGDYSQRTFFDRYIYKAYITDQNQGRLRMAWALSQIWVTDVEALSGGWMPSFLACHHHDLCMKHAFGNYRDLMHDMTLSTGMGLYLSLKGSRAADGKGRQPDENFAREIMQLFTIGLHELNQDGTPKLVNGKPDETYDNNDIIGIARALTGWDHLRPESKFYTATNPMINYDEYHDKGEKSFMGQTIPAGTDAKNSLKIVLDVLFNHPNVGPFIGRQLIQRMVTSNPSRGYIEDIAKVFNNNGSGQRGDLGAVFSAILLHPEARVLPTTADALKKSGKLREPVLRFTALTRALKCYSSNNWGISKPGVRALNGIDELSQSPGRAPSVFNFYSPNYRLPSATNGDSGLFAPEFQIANEGSVAGYLNFMQSLISSDGDLLKTLTPDYSEWIAAASSPSTLVYLANLLLAGGGLSLKTISEIEAVIQKMPGTTSSERKKRAQAAMLLTMASGDALVVH